MRPLKLVMSAFGPYAGVQEIAFEELGEAGIYLITGETGAGKTTIFDGITFALFGEASGNDRDAKMFRSKYADANAKTYVELTFLYKGKTYIVKRNPDYERPKLRGEGTSLEKADATLTLPDGSIVTKSKEVTKKIEEILGVNYNQFTKIVMIAQGAFKEFLFADTDDRHEIFRKIFGTGKFYSLQIRLAQESKALEESCGQIRMSVEQYLRDTVCDQDSLNALEFEAVHEGSRSVDDSLEIIRAIIEEDRKAEKQVSAALSEVEEQIGELNKQIGQVKEIERARELLKENQDKLPVLQEQLNDAERKQKEMAKMQPKLQLLQEEVTRIGIELESIKQKESYEKTLAAEVNKRQKLLNQNLLTQQKKEELETGLEANRSEYRELADAAEKLQNLKEVESNYKQEKSQLDAVDVQLIKLERTNQKLARTQEDYQECQKQYDVCRENYEEMKRSFLKEQAGILALELKEGIPCPVCGSTHHPLPAQITQKAISKEELEKYEKLVNEKMEMAQEKSHEAGAYLATCKEQREVLEIYIEDLWNEELLQDNSTAEMILWTKKTLNTRRGMLEEKCLSNTKEMEKEKKRLARYENLEKMIEHSQQELEACAAQYVENLEKISTMTGAIDKMQQQIAELTKQLPYENLQEAESLLKNKSKEAARISCEMKETEEQFHSIRQQYGEVKASIGSYLELLEQVQELNSVGLDEKLAVKMEEKEKLREKKEATTGRISTNESACANIAKKQKNLSELEKQSIMVKNLSDTANAKLTGKQKIELETYVQMAYFERILRRANARFLRMSNDQYELIRRVDGNNLRVKVGLDLDVIDHFNGSVRSVKSLSGGEAFKASLALALGLSDEIQSLAGGIQFDSMFIDEGFGSLDEESLRQAIFVLTELSEGNRLVGIISHVGELKERIDKQIVISKSQSGATAKIL